MWTTFIEDLVITTITSKVCNVIFIHGVIQIDVKIISSRLADIQILLWVWSQNPVG